MNILLIINFIIILFKNLLTAFSPINAYLLWDISLMFHIISLSYVVGKLLPRSNLTGRIVNFSLLILSCIFFIEYIVKCLTMYYGVGNIINYIIYASLIGIVLPLVANMLFPLSNTLNRYTKRGYYIAYKRGTSKLGMLFGHSFIICKGIRYYYKKGRLIKDEFKHSKNYIYKRIDKIEVSKLDKMLGCKWSIFNNCYDLKNRIERND